jgi:hypothetical protein
VAVVALVLPACAVGGPSGDDNSETTATTRPFGTKAVIVGSTTTSTPTADGGTAPSTSTTRATGSTQQTTTTEPAAPMALLARITDRTGDHGVFGPPQSDLTAVTIETNDVAVRITVTLAGDVPSTLAATDVEGIGVDLFRPGNTDRGRSDSQVFATGDASGWYGYLSVGKAEPRPMPGSLTIDGAKVVFEVPIEELHAPPRGSFSGFVDFSRDATPTNRSTEDHAPDLGTSPYPSDAR